MATHSIWAFTFRSSARCININSGKIYMKKTTQTSLPNYSQKQKSPSPFCWWHVEAIPGKMAPQRSMAQDFLGGTTQLDPWKSQKDKNNRTPLSVLPHTLFFPFLRGKIGAYLGAWHQKHPNCRVPPLHYPQTMPPTPLGSLLSLETTPLSPHLTKINDWKAFHNQ